MLNVTQSRELQAAIYGTRLARRGIRLNINKRARTQARPLWQQALGARARTSIERKVIPAGARAAVSDRAVKLVAASSRRPLSGGLVPADEWAGSEFGASPKRVTVSQRSRSGRIYRRPLTIQTQFRARVAEGRIAFDAASEVGTKVVALWVHSVVDVMSEIPGVEVTP